MCHSRLANALAAADDIEPCEVILGGQRLRARLAPPVSGDARAALVRTVAVRFPALRADGLAAADRWLLRPSSTEVPQERQFSAEAMAKI